MDSEQIISARVRAPGDGLLGVRCGDGGLREDRAEHRLTNNAGESDGDPMKRRCAGFTPGQRTPAVPASNLPKDRARLERHPLKEDPCDD